MITQFGSVEGWQKAKTFEWIERIRDEFLSKGKSVLFDGQMRISFILEACKAAGIINYEVVLVDCDDSSRESRLRLDRRQPELATERMMNWARFLRNEALAADVLILDTSEHSIESCMSQILTLLGNPERSSGLVAGHRKWLQRRQEPAGHVQKDATSAKHLNSVEFNCAKSIDYGPVA
jgi:hypothetical protein